MDDLKTAGEKFDIVFLDAPKDQYIPYHKFALDMLTPSGFIMADNSRCALRMLYDEDDSRRQPLHDFNQMVKKEKRVEQPSGAFKGGHVYYKTKKISVKEFLYDILYNP